MISKNEIAIAFGLIQDSICKALEEIDGKAKFKEDIWERPGGGGGKSRIIEEGNIFEKGGVNFSEVHGEAPDFVMQKNESSPNTFYATGVSIVMHPQSPMVPIIHMNIRYMELNNNTCWFGGGIDLTPIYIVEEDVRFFHRHLKSVCDESGTTLYPKFKSWADEYFFIRHRNETRGAGGIFYDRLEADEEFSIERLFAFTQAIGESFIPIYAELVNRNKSREYGEREKQWQLIRRGRYAEFNLVYDRGTRFGLETEGRTESILMSLPPMAAWKYNFSPEAGSEESKTQQFLCKGIDWI
ncbi:MAG: oxygen-dependent coproporphyrinogen oxidase [Bacteroidota bacterium]